jgi:acetylornithine aminotransferase
MTCPDSKKCNLQCKKLSDIPLKTIGGFDFEPGSSSGIGFPPEVVIRNIVHLVRQNGGFIHINEVTTGIGRTGKWFGYQHYGISPDVVSMGKGLGSGYPVSATAMSLNVVKALANTHFHYLQSHQNNPLGCAVAKQVITIIKQEEIIEKSREAGEYFIMRLLQLHRKYPIIKEVRGRGLMIILEFSESVDDERISSIYHQCQQRGFLFSRGLKTFRFDPPLIIDKEKIDSFLKNFKDVLDYDRTRTE